ncbi:MAG: hypothetical protein JFR38_01975 [Muribaculaceae bacterium]|nr:hypothetical protein [Muribaculaceae bacterium]
MNRVIRHIEHLLITHDCVIVPGIGAVLATSMGARMDASGSRMFAPSRVFTFNPALSHNDGVLASSIARAEGISYDAAGRMLEAATSEMRSRLDAEARLGLGRVGTLMRNADGSMRFAPGSLEVLSPGVMWLPEVNLAAFSAGADSASQVRAVRRADFKPRRLGVSLSRIAKMAAAVAVLIAVGLTLTTPLKVDDAQMASLGVETFSPRHEAPAIIETPGMAEAPVVLVIERHSDAATPVDTAAYTAMRHGARAARKAALSGPRYCLVVASLASEAEARKYVESVDDPALSILVKDGRYRVYAAEGASALEVIAIAEATGVASRYPSAWVCRK